MKPRHSLMVAAGLLAAVSLALLFSRTGPASAPAAGQSAGNGSAAASAADHSAAPRAPRTRSATDRKVKDAELAARYGESRTQLARKLGNDLVGMLDECVGLGKTVMDLHLDADGKGKHLPAELAPIGQKLALTPDQQAKAAAIIERHNARMFETAGRFVDGLKNDPTPLMESLLAGDACKNGRLSEAEFAQVRDGLRGRMSSTMGLMGMDGGKSADAFQDDVVNEELTAMLDGTQQEVFRQFVQERADAAKDAPAAEATDSMPMDFTRVMDLEEAGRNIDSLKKISTGLKSLVDGIGALQSLKNNGNP